MVSSTKAKSDSFTSPRTATIDMMRGLTFPWTLLSSAIIGLFFLFTRLFLGTTGVIANSDHLVGSLIITVAIIATAEVARPLRFINVLFGLWLMLAPWIISGGSHLAAGVGVLLGIALIMLSLPRGNRGQEHYGSWDNYVA